MMNFLLVCVCAFSVPTAAAAGLYPTTYPYDVDAYPVLPASTPDMVFDDTGVGGYLYTAYQTDITADMFPHAMTKLWYPYMMVVMYNAPSSMPPNYWNCTAKDRVFVSEDFTGVVGDQTVCTDCCASLIGLPKFAKSQTTSHDWFSGMYTLGMCTETMLEIFYCANVNGNAQAMCYEFMLSPTERTVPSVHYCTDLSYDYWVQCPVVARTGLSTGFKFEPPSYMSMLTLEQNLFHNCLPITLDRVCFPSSYYYPEASATSETSTPTSSVTTTTSSAVMVTAVSFMFLI